MLYGQRKAPQQWTEFVAKVLVDHLGLIRDVACPNIYYGTKTSSFPQMVVDTHADDFHGTGPTAVLQEFLGEFRRLVKLKKVELHGTESTYSHLRRSRRRTVRGTWILANNKYLDKALDLMGLAGCKAAPTPMVSEVAVVDVDHDSVLPPEQASVYRSVTMLLMYYVPDHFEAQYAAKELPRET